MLLIGMSNYSKIYDSLHCWSRGIPLAFGLILLVLALIKAVEYWRLRMFYGSRLIKVLITDQIVYFAA